MASPPKKFAVALFEGFQSLDVFGPVDILNFLSLFESLEFSLIAPSLDPVSTLHNAPSRIGQQIVPTHTYENAPDDIEVLLVPGGMGTRDLEYTKVVVDFVRARFPKLRYLLTVCTGSAIAARAGVLEGLKATSNKKSFSWVSRQYSTLKSPHPSISFPTMKAGLMFFDVGCVTWRKHNMD